MAKWEIRFQRFALSFWLFTLGHCCFRFPLAFSIQPLAFVTGANEKFHLSPAGRSSHRYQYYNTRNRPVYGRAGFAGEINAIEFAEPVADMAKAESQGLNPEAAGLHCVSPRQGIQEPDSGRIINRRERKERKGGRGLVAPSCRAEVNEGEAGEG